MEFPSAKDLKKLAKACRSAGIISFKGAGIEFTLTPEAPLKVAKSQLKETPSQLKDLGENIIESDELASDAMLFWSVNDQPAEGNEQ